LILSFLFNSALAALVSSRNNLRIVSASLWICISGLSIGPALIVIVLSATRKWYTESFFSVKRTVRSQSWIASLVFSFSRPSASFSFVSHCNSIRWHGALNVSYSCFVGEFNDGLSHFLCSSTTSINFLTFSVMISNLPSLIAFLSVIAPPTPNDQLPMQRHQHQALDLQFLDLHHLLEPMGSGVTDL